MATSETPTPVLVEPVNGSVERCVTETSRLGRDLEESLLAIDAPLNILELMKRVNAEISVLSRENAVLKSKNSMLQNENLILKNKESMLERENELFTNKISSLRNELLLAQRKIESGSKDKKEVVTDEAVELKNGSAECNNKQIVCSAPASLKSSNASTPND